MRRRLAVALLAWVAAWPVVPLALQLGWDADPWKLMSFGMYAAPARRPEDVGVELWAAREGRWAPVETARLAAEVRRFQQHRQTFGTLASPRRLLLALGEETGGEAVRLEVAVPRLDPKSARIRIERERHELRRR